MLASGGQGQRLPIAAPLPEKTLVLDRGDVAARTVEAERPVTKYIQGWDTPRLQALNAQREKSKTGRGRKALKHATAAVVLVISATGSLGSHIVQKLAENPLVFQVVCINRRSNSVPAEKRQQDAFLTKGITLTPGARAKLRVIETDTSKAQLGLPPREYSALVQNVTHIVHNAWPMSRTRPVGAFEPQFHTMRNLMDLTREAATTRSDLRMGFQLVSFIGVVGFCGESRVMEQRAPLSAVLPSGYGEGKWVCERMLDATLHKYPGLFRSRVGVSACARHLCLSLGTRRREPEWPSFSLATLSVCRTMA